MEGATAKRQQREQSMSVSFPRGLVGWVRNRGLSERLLYRMPSVLAKWVTLLSQRCLQDLDFEHRGSRESLRVGNDVT